MFRICVLILVLLAGTVAPAWSADGDRPFRSDTDAMAEADAALARAEERGTRLLLVFGANWCHDSRGLAGHFAQDDMAALIAEHYELVWIDIAWRERNIDVLHRFGAAAIYGTPTVLIYDPAQGLMNADTMHSWHTAYSRSHDAVVEYFTVWADARPAASLTATSAVYQQLIADIDAWEMREAVRLNAAYAEHAAWREELAPHFERAGNDEESARQVELFHSVEQDIDRHRSNMRADRDDLHAQAHERVRDALLVLAGDEPLGFDTVAALDANPPEITLDYPSYPDPLYPWEDE